MWQRFTERARRVVFFSQEEAARLGESYVGTEHLLLGLIRESDSVAGRILDRLGVPLNLIRDDIERQVTGGLGNIGQDMQLTPRAKRVIDLAYEEARQLNNNYIGTEHLLLGLIRDGDGLAARVLIHLGADLESTRREVGAMQEGEDAERRRPAVTLGAALTVCAGLADLTGIRDLLPEQVETILGIAAGFKETFKRNRMSQNHILAGRTVALLFEKPSLRTRTTFDTGVYQLGGHGIYLSPAEVGLGKRESVADVARNLERWVDAIVARVFSHQTIVDLAEHANVPVVNALCDREHPCQALADALTIIERRGGIAGQRIVYVGDGNNVAHSLMLLCAKLGGHVVLSGPEGYDADPEMVAAARADAAVSGGFVELVRDPREACRDADVVYTDTWTSMGQESEAAERVRIFAPYQVNDALVSVARPDHLFMHCLPAHRGEEVTDAVLDGPNSVIFDQAENRLHAQKAVLAVLIR